MACQSWPLSAGCVRLLVDRGADVTAVNDDIANVLHALAVRISDKDLDVKLLDDIIKASGGDGDSLLTSANVAGAVPLFVVWQRMLDDDQEEDHHYVGNEELSRWVLELRHNAPLLCDDDRESDEGSRSSNGALWRSSNTHLPRKLHVFVIVFTIKS